MVPSEMILVVFFGQLPDKTEMSKLCFKYNLTSPHAAKILTLHLMNSFIFTFLIYSA